MNMRLHSFRTFFALLLMLTLGGIGIYLGLQVRGLPGFGTIPSGDDLVHTIAFYETKVTIALGAVGADR